VNRLTALRASMTEAGIDFLVLSGKEDILYLSGFYGSRALSLITLDFALLCVDFRYTEQAARQASGWEIIGSSGELFFRLKDMMSAAGTDRLYFDPAGMGYLDYTELAEALPGCELLPSAHMIRKLRAVKDSGEVELIIQAQRLAEASYVDIINRGLCDHSEKRLAADIDCAMIQGGADKPAFDTIVLAGPRSSMPHAIAGENSVGWNDNVLIDWGARRKYYNSDTTRTLFCGKMDTRLNKIYDIVLQAQIMALEAAVPGIPCRDLDRIAREYISNMGYGDNFGHGLGHGVGLEIHELPILNPSSREILQPGMVITIEPGIYLPDTGGVRIEDLVLITENGSKNLTGLSKERIIM
jgi:Xaa-Pro aminopeptidase